MLVSCPTFHIKIIAPNIRKLAFIQLQPGEKRGKMLFGLCLELGFVHPTHFVTNLLLHSPDTNGGYPQSAECQLSTFWPDLFSEKYNQLLLSLRGDIHEYCRLNLT